MVNSGHRGGRAGHMVAALLICLGSPAGAGDPSADEPPSTGVQPTPVEQAESAFVAGQLQRTLELASTVEDSDPQAARARYIEGYAHYKLGQIERAGQVLARALALDPAPRVVFLAGLVAFERRQWSEVLKHLPPLAAAGQEPWAKPARDLAARARQALDDEQRAAVLARHAAAIRSAEQHLQRGELQQADAALARAEQAQPEHVLNHYYRGYLAYRRADCVTARRHLRQALAVKPNDPWARYMLALCLDERAEDRRAILEQVARSGPDATLRQAARRALTPPPTPRSHLSVVLELGGGVDTNPAYAASPGNAPPQPTLGPAPPPEPTTDSTTELAAALRGQATLRYQRRLGTRHTGAVGLRLLEQGYAAGGEGLEQTQAAAGIDYTLALDRLTLAAGYGYALHLLGHEPLMSLHDLDVEAYLPLASWLRLASRAGFRARDMHDDAYRYLEALEVSGLVALEARWRFVTLQAGYFLLRGWSEAEETTLSERPDPRGQTIVTTYRTDYTQVTHGPQLRLALALPWRLAFEATAWALWYGFDRPDRFTVYPMDEVVWQQDRRDIQIIALAELRRPVALGFEAAIQLTTVDNISSLDSAAPVNRSYARRMVLGLVRWRWPMR